jgi:hypothetical protein
MQTSQNQQNDGLLLSLARFIGKKRAGLGKAFSSCFVLAPWFGPTAFSLLATFLFYYPSIRNGSQDAGFLYGGDVIGFYWPYLAKLQYLLSRHHFVALDFGQFNASSDFFLTANFFPCHPLFVLWALCSSPETTTFQEAGRILALGLAIHSFIACSTATAMTIEPTQGLTEENLFTTVCGMGAERLPLNRYYGIPMPDKIRKAISIR